jgi:hypothetical protein
VPRPPFHALCRPVGGELRLRPPDFHALPDLLWRRAGGAEAADSPCAAYAAERRRGPCCSALPLAAAGVSGVRARCCAMSAAAHCCYALAEGKDGLNVIVYFWDTLPIWTCPRAMSRRAPCRDERGPSPRMGAHPDMKAGIPEWTAITRWPQTMSD